MSNLILSSCEEIDPPLWLEEAEQTANRILELREIGNWELSLHFCTDKRIRELNRQYRNKDTATDVLSFGSIKEDFPGQLQPGERYIAGDIIISVETVIRQCEEMKIPFKKELKRLIIHGILHLCGYDHDENNKTMLELQETLLKVIWEE